MNEHSMNFAQNNNYAQKPPEWDGVLQIGDAFTIVPLLPCFGASGEMGVYQICCFNHIAPKGLRSLPASLFSAGREHHNHCDAILLRSHKLQVAEIGPATCAIARAGAGINNIPLPECSNRGIVVFNTPGANANSVKELVICAMLLSSRKLQESLQWLSGLNNEDLHQIEAGKKLFAGPELLGKTLGIIGLGAVGSLVANAAEDLGMRVIGYDPFLSVQNALRLPRAIQLLEQMNELLKQSDYVSLHLPLSPKTTRLLSDFEAVKTDARLINFARAELVDEEAVAAALKNGQLSYYVSDFPSCHFAGVPGAICFPHLGASTPEAEENCAVMACEQLADFLLHGNIRNSVNYPNCELERTREHRLTFAHKNIPNMLGQISSNLAKQQLNIQELSNRHREAFDYTIVDVDAAPSRATLAELRSIPGILRLRHLLPPDIA